MTKVTLSALEPEDLEVLYTIENDFQMWSTSDANAPYSHYALRNYISSQQFDIYADKQVRFVMRVDGKAIGLIDLFNFSPQHLRAEMGVAVLKEEQGKGYAEQAIQELQQYCRNTLNLHQIYCIVPTDNAPSIAMLRKTGFTEVVTLKDWLLNADTWKDAVMLHYVFSGEECDK